MPVNRRKVSVLFFCCCFCFWKYFSYIDQENLWALSSHHVCWSVDFLFIKTLCFILPRLETWAVGFFGLAFLHILSFLHVWVFFFFFSEFYLWLSVATSLGSSCLCLLRGRLYYHTNFWSFFVSVLLATSISFLLSCLGRLTRAPVSSLPFTWL